MGAHCMFSRIEGRKKRGRMMNSDQDRANQSDHACPATRWNRVFCDHCVEPESKSHRILSSFPVRCIVQHLDHLVTQLRRGVVTHHRVRLA